MPKHGRGLAQAWTQARQSKGRNMGEQIHKKIESDEEARKRMESPYYLFPHPTLKRT